MKPSVTVPWDHRHGNIAHEQLLHCGFLFWTGSLLTSIHPSWIWQPLTNLQAKLCQGQDFVLFLAFSAFSSIHNGIIAGRPAGRVRMSSLHCGILFRSTLGSRDVASLLLFSFTLGSRVVPFTFQPTYTLGSSPPFFL